MASDLLSKTADGHRTRWSPEAVMDPLGELLATGQRQALEFFFMHLQDVSGPAVNRQELLYNASVLAHYAQVSTQTDLELSPPGDLSEIFDYFVSDTSQPHESRLETAGAQCLVLAGFFE